MGAVKNMMCMFKRWHSRHGLDFASTLCKYDLRKGDVFVQSETRGDK